MFLRVQKYHGIGKTIKEGVAERQEQLNNMPTEELLSFSNNKLLKNSNSSDENKAEYLRKTLLLRDITADLPRQTINSVISMANNVANFFSLGIIEKNSFPTVKDNSVLKDSEKYGDYSSKEELTKEIQENKKELYLKTGTYNPSANLVADTIVDIASFALLNKAGMNTTSALVTSSAVDTLGETGSVEDASKSVVSSYLFSRILDSKLTSKIQETSSKKISKFIENIAAKNPEIVNSQLRKDIAEALPDVLSNFTSVGISRGIAGESNAIMQQGKEALNSDTQKNILLDSMVWATFSAGLTGYRGVKLKIENKEMEKAKIDNLYKDLGLDPSNTYTIDELNAQYKKLSKQNHPDLAHGDEKLQAQYTEKMQKINSSYNQLKQYLTEHKLYEPEFKAFPTNDDIDVGYILKSLDDGVKILKDNTIYVDTNNALINTAKSIANSQIINTTVPIIQDNQVIGFSKERVVPFNVENSKIDVFPGITLSQDGAIDIIDINSGTKLLTNAKDIQTAINSVTDGLRNPDEKTISFINNSINKSKFESLKAIEQIANTIQDKANQMKVNPKANNEPEAKISNSNKEITNYTNSDIKRVIEPFSAKKSYTKKEIANIWNNISEKNYDATYDKNGNIEKYIAIENDGRNIVVNKYNNNDEIEKSIAVHNDNGEFSADEIQDAITRVSSNIDLDPFIQEMAVKFQEDLTNSIPGERYKAGDKWTGQKRSTTKELAKIKDNTGASWDNINKVLDDIANGRHNNTKLAKIISNLLDDSLSNGYRNIYGKNVMPNDEYLEQKGKLYGKDFKVQEVDYDPTEYMTDEDMMIFGENKTVNNDTINYTGVSNLSFSEQVDIWKEGKLGKNTHLLVLKHTPEIYQKLGAKDLPITIVANKLQRIYNESGKQQGRYHGLGEKVKELPRAIEHPLNVVLSTTQQDSFVVITDLSDNNDNIVVISLKLDGNGQVEIDTVNQNVSANVLTSAYGRENYDRQNKKINGNYKGWMEQNFEKDKIIYDIDEGIIKKPIKGQRLELPNSNNKPVTTNTNSSNIKDIIPQSASTVKNDKNISNNFMQNNENNSTQKESSQIANNNIQDFGDKIGGARKDLSIKRNAAETKKEIIHDYTTKKAENSKLDVNDKINNTHYMKISKSNMQRSGSLEENIHFAKKSAKKSGQQNKTKTNAEREGSYIEQEITKIEETGNWDNSIPVTTRREIRQTIEDYLGIGIKKGHFRERAYGIYKDKRNVIRTKETKDIDTILHEAGHATDIGKRINIDKDAIADELFKAVENYGGYETEIRSVKLDEGFAEVIREYCTVPERAKADYPQTVAALEEIRKKDTSFDKFISKVQGQIYNYIHQNPRNRVISNQSIGKQTDMPKFSKEYIKQEVMRNIYDKDYALKSAVNELEKISGKKAKASENAYYLVRLSSGIGDKISSMLSDGYIDENGNKLMPGLSQIGEILGNNPERFNDLRAYLSAKRDADYKSQELKTGIRSTDAENIVKKFENDPQIQEASKLIRATLDGVMQYAINNGLISQESADELKKKNTFYIPMQRVFDRQGNKVGKRGAVTEIIKARKGSELDIKDVLENVITNSSNIIQQVENNNILRALFKQGEESGLTGTVYDVIDTPMEYAGKAQLEMWRDELKKQGVDVEKLDLDKTIDLFTTNNKIDSKNLITSFINEDGQRIYLQFNDELVFNSIMNMDKKFMSDVLKINSWLNMPLRYGATMANLGFAIPNMISDTAQAAIYSEAGFIPVVDNALGVLDIMASTNSAVKKFMDKVAPEYSKKINNLYKIYSQSGAMSSTRLSQYRKSTQKSMKDIYGVNKSEDIGIEEKFKPLKRVLDLLTYIPEISEQSTRFEVFKKNYNYYIEKGNSENDSRILAALESRDATQDFGRTGNLTREINQLIPFSAARVDGAYTFVEKVQGNPKKIGIRIAILTAIAFAIKALGYKDKEIEELNQRKKDDNFILKVGNNVITIKKPQGILRSIINLGEYIQDLFTGHIEDGKEGEKLGNWLTNAIMDNMPADSVTGLVPNMVAPLIENAINKDFYYNTPIVKSYDEDLPDSEQYYEYNSQLAILLGKAFNYSPAKIDNLISGYFAGLGTSITSAMDYVSGKLGLSAQKPEMGAESNSIGKRFFVNVDSNSASLDEVYNRKTELTKLKNGGTISEDETKELETLTEASNNIAKINKQIKSIKADLTTSGKEKATKIKELQQQRTDIARQALGKELINSENSSKIDLTKYYPSNNTLSKNGYTLNLTDSQKEEYSKLAQEYYTKYSKQGLYDEDKLKTKAKDYAKNELFKKYKSSLTKTTK